MEAIVFILLFAGGCLSGLFAGLMGLGGGMLFMLIFTNYLVYIKVPVQFIPQLILANAMLAMFIGGCSGSLKHYLSGNLPIKAVFLTGCAATLAALTVTHYFIHSRWYNKDVFTSIFILVVTYVAVKTLYFKPRPLKNDRPQNSSNLKFLFIGGVGGALSSLAGVGGGIAMIPMLTNMLRINIKESMAISLGVITVVSFSIALYAAFVAPSVNLGIPYTYGQILLPMTLPVSIGCLIFAPIGVSLSHKLTNGQIKFIYVIFLITAIVNMLYTLVI